MKRGLFAAVLLLVACDDEVVGFAQDTASTGTVATTTGEPSATTTGGEGSSSSGEEEGSSSTGTIALELPDFVAFGIERGVAISRDDGLSWQDVNALADMSNLEGAVRGEDVVVLVGGANSATTTDGESWTVHAVDGLGYARDVAYGAGGFASVGLDHLAWSEDGETWQDARGGSTEFDFVAVAYGDGRFVAVGVNQIATSTNGQEWTVTNAPGEKLHTVAYGAGRFVAVGEQGRLVETVDGVDLVRDEQTSMSNLGELRYCNDSFAIGAAGAFWFSSDGQDWNEVLTGSQGAFACSGSSWVIVKDEGLFHGPAVTGLTLAHTPPEVLSRAEFTAAG